MSYFTKNFTQFFKDLANNNNKDWFTENKKTYQKEVREPMIAFVEDVIKEMQKVDIGYDPVPHKCLGRINRDIRFSKDKTPYNTHFYAHISKGPKESPIPGIAFRFGTDHSGIMSGYYQPSKEKLYDIRNKIANNLSEFNLLKTDKYFVKKYGTIQGDALKRIPKEWQEAYEKEELIANKQFYYVAHKKPEFVSSKNLLKEVIDHWHAARPMNDFLT